MATTIVCACESREYDSIAVLYELESKHFDTYESLC